MKRFILPMLFLAAMPAFAVDKEPAKDATKPPACGKTAEECQRMVDSLTEQNSDLQAAYALVRQQRAIAVSNKDDAEVQNFIAQRQSSRQQEKDKKAAAAAAPH
jgi:hypothetical protein